MIMPGNTQTVHTPSGNSKKETKGRYRQTETANPHNNREPGNKPTIEMPQETLHSDRRTIQDLSRPADRVPIHAGVPSHKTGSGKHDLLKIDKGPSAIKIASQSRRNLSGTGLTLLKHHKKEIVLPIDPEPAIELLPHPIVQKLQELKTELKAEVKVDRGRGDRELHSGAVHPSYSIFSIKYSLYF